MASKAELENRLRKAMQDNIIKMIEQVYDTDALFVSASEIAVPVIDDEKNEKFVLIKVSIPRGTRNGEGGYKPYNGYAAAESYADDLASKAQEKAVKKAMKEAEKKGGKK